MRVINIFIFACLLTFELQAQFVGSIGFVSPNYPDYGRYRPSQDVDEFFEEFIDAAFKSYSDAGVSVANKLNMKRGDVLYKEIEYNNTLLIPSEENREAIEEFYANNSIRFLKKIAKENKVDIILYSSFNKTKLKRIIRNQENPSTLVYRVFAYDVQSGSKKSEYIKIEVTDLFTTPDYDPVELQALLIEKYLKIFQDLLGHMQVIGSSYSSDESAQSNSQSSTNNSQNDSGDW